MPKRVLDVGNCTADHGAVRRLIESEFDAEVTQAHSTDEALSALRRNSFDLVLVNRVFDRDGASGMGLIEQIRADDELSRLPVMLITNFPQHQQAAIAAGASAGFGKADLHSPATRERLNDVLASW